MTGDPGLTAYNNMTDREIVDKMNELKAAGTELEMPRYKCHKEVWALKIADVKDPTEPGNESDGTRIIIPADTGYSPFIVDRDYVRKHNPQSGGYYIVYADGYKSFSPAKAFEDGYARL